jgi:hypothetical protein
MRIGEIHDLQDLRPPEPAEADCLHHSFRSRLRVSRLLRVRESASLALSPNMVRATESGAVRLDILAEEGQNPSHDIRTGLLNIMYIIGVT